MCLYILHSTNKLINLFNQPEVKTMKLENKMSLLNKGFKIVVFLVLFIIVMWQYAVEIYAKFNSVSTTFVSKTVVADSFAMPPMTIFMDNGLKPSVLKKYGIADIFEFSFQILDTKNFSVWDAFVEASYLIGRDIEICLLVPILSGAPIPLKIGNNYFTGFNGNHFHIEVKKYHTNIAGTGYQIKSNITMYVSPQLGGIKDILEMKHTTLLYYL